MVGAWRVKLLPDLLCALAEVQPAGNCRSCVAFSHCLAVPASALGINLLERLRVHLARPGEASTQRSLFNPVVVVDKSANETVTGPKVAAGTELRRMPCQINIERRHSCLAPMYLEYVHESPVLDCQSVHGEVECGRMKPVEPVHFLDKLALP